MAKRGGTIGRRDIETGDGIDERARANDCAWGLCGGLGRTQDNFAWPCRWEMGATAFPIVVGHVTTCNTSLTVVSRYN